MILFNGFLADSKRKIKHVLDSGTGRAELSLSGLKDGIRYVSFDIFDTLIVRDVSRPSDVFRIMEKRLRDPLFSEKRVRAEKTARTKSADHEVTIYDIYQCFEGITPEKVKNYISLELDTELLVCRPDGRTIRFYEQCREHYPMILISDMYLPGGLMEKLLGKCGITGYQKLYISCDLHRTKRSGALYDHVLSDLCINAGQLLHIGNDIVSDLLCARRKGLHAIKVRPAPSLLATGAKDPCIADRNCPLQMQVLCNFMKNTANSPHRRFDVLYGYGRETLGVILFGFCKWLIKKMKEDGTEQVLFTGENAPLIKAAYDALAHTNIIPSFTAEHLPDMNKKTALAAVGDGGMKQAANGSTENIRGYCIIAAQKHPVCGFPAESYRVSDDTEENERFADIFRYINSGPQSGAEQLRQGTLDLVREAQQSCIAEWKYIRSDNAFYFLKNSAKKPFPDKI